MDDPVEAIKGAFRDLSEFAQGVEVVEGASYDLRIADPMLAVWLQPLSREGVNDNPNPPNPFDSQTTFLGEEGSVPIPWMAPTQEYADRYLNPYDDFVVVFADYGEVRTGTDAATHERQARRKLEQKQEELSAAGIEPERQIIITLDGRVRETITHRIAAYYLTTRGWFVSTDFQYLPSGDRGVPDIIAWKSPLTEAIRQAGLVRNGALLEELAYLHCLDVAPSDMVPTISENTATKTLVGEVKGENRSLGEAHRQLQKYLEWNVFDSGYSVVPGYCGHERSGSGMLTFDSGGFDFVPDEKDRSTLATREQFIEHMDTAARQALLSGLPFSDLIELATFSGATDIETPHALANRLRSLDSEIIIESAMARTEKNNG